MASSNCSVTSTHKATILRFPRVAAHIHTTDHAGTRKNKITVVPKAGTCPTCNEPANMNDGILCKDCGAFLCDHPKCACLCDRIAKIAERVMLDILTHPKMYGLQKI
jgi:hypothetical protein